MLIPRFAVEPEQRGDFVVEDMPKPPDGFVIEDFDLNQFNQNPSVVNPQTGNPIAMPRDPQGLGASALEFAGEMGGGVAGEALGMGLLAGAGLSNPITAIPAAGILGGMGAYLGGNLAREASGTQTPEQEPTLEGLAVSGGAGAALNLVPGLYQARQASKAAKAGFMLPTDMEIFDAAKKLKAPVGGGSSRVVGSFGIGKLIKSNAAEKVNTAVNDAVVDLVSGKLGLPDRAARNALWKQYGAELVQKAGGEEALFPVSDGFKKAFEFFKMNPDQVPPSLKSNWAKWSGPVENQIFWPGAQGGKIYRGSLKNTPAMITIEEVPRSDGLVSLIVRKGNSKPKSVAVAPHIEMDVKLDQAAKLFGERSAGLVDEVGTGKVTFQDIKDIYVGTREGVSAEDYKTMTEQAQKYLSMMRDGAEESLHNVNTAVSDAITNQHKPLANMGQAAQQIQGAIAKASEKIKGPNGEMVTVFNPRKFADIVKKTEGLWEPRTTGSSLLTPEQRTTLKEWTKTFEATSADLANFKRMYSRGMPTLWDAIKETGGIVGGAGVASQYTPLPGTDYVMVAPGFDALMALALTSPTARMALKGAPKLAGKAVKFGAAANAPRLDVFGNKEKK